MGKGRGKAAKSLALIEASQRILEEIQPASVRAVCYQLFVKGLIPAMTKGATDAVGQHLKWAREEGVIPWAYIVDESRRIESIAQWNNPDEIIRVAINSYRKNCWATQPVRIEVWSEKGTIRGALAPVLDEFGVDFRVLHGFGSATVLHEIAELSADSDKPTIALYCGDWDPSGLHMSERDLPQRLARYGGVVELVRFALTEGDLPGLPSFSLESKAKDTRAKWFLENHGSKCWELDAMSPVTLRERLRANIMARLDGEAWARAVEVEGVERESMTDILSAWKKSKSMPAHKYSEGAP